MEINDYLSNDLIDEIKEYLGLNDNDGLPHSEKIYLSYVNDIPYLIMENDNCSNYYSDDSDYYSEDSNIIYALNLKTLENCTYYSITKDLSPELKDKIYEFYKTNNRKFNQRIVNKFDATEEIKR
jgi:hypothetical protein